MIIIVARYVCIDFNIFFYGALKLSFENVELGCNRLMFQSLYNSITVVEGCSNVRRIYVHYTEILSLVLGFFLWCIY